MSTSMVISEMFGPALQGEGPNLGKPAYFIRLAGCNLQCGFSTGEATWVCDSKAIWSQAKLQLSTLEVKQRLCEAGVFDNFLAGKLILVFTGGEPTLPKHREAITDFIQYIQRTYPFATPFYEIETNGAVDNVPGEFWDMFSQINCSPKLSNSGIPLDERVRPDSLRQLASRWQTVFKFVVSTDLDFYKEIKPLFIDTLLISPDKISLMPAGLDIEELEKTSKVVWELCCKHNIRMTTRLQIYTWRTRTGV